MRISPYFLYENPISDGFCAPVFDPTLGNNGAIGTIAGSYSLRCMVPAAAMALGGLDDLVTAMRVTFQAGTTAPLRIRRAYIGHKHSTDEYAYASNVATQIFFNGGDPGVEIASGNQITGVAAFAWDKTSDVVIGIDLDDGSNSNAWAATTGCKTWSTQSGDAANPEANPPECFVKNTTLNANGNGAQGYTYRARIPQANLALAGFTGPGDTAIISLISSTTSGQNLRISKLYIGHASASGHAYADTPVQFLFPGSAPTVVVSSGGNRITAEAPFAYNGTSDLIIGCSFTSGAGNVGHRINAAVAGENTYSKAASTEADASNPSGFALTANYSFIESLQFYPRACPLPFVITTPPTNNYNMIKRLQANGCP